MEQITQHRFIQQACHSAIDRAVLPHGNRKQQTNVVLFLVGKVEHRQRSFAQQRMANIRRRVRQNQSSRLQLSLSHPVHEQNLLKSRRSNQVLRLLERILR
ncbi:hypothetical protein SDC9_189981 [bioreactor metagenome]|uniref:Uncharacterized protein n=1 Tax=bioreactor metagenome TaxID=1076179 RepID=A0A645I1T7_9ZZZZ